MSFSEVSSSSAWVWSNVVATTTELFRFFGLPSDLLRMLDRTLVPKFAISFFDERSTQVDASNYKHSILKNQPFDKRRISTCFSFLKVVFLSGSLFPRKSVVGSWMDANSFLFIGYSLILRTVFHSTLISSRALTFCCPLYSISIVSFPFPYSFPWLQ